MNKNISRNTEIKVCGIKNVLIFVPNQPSKSKPHIMELLIMKPEDAILNHLKENGQSISWLARKLELSTGHLYHVLKGDKGKKRELSDKNLQRINEILKTNY